VTELERLVSDGEATEPIELRRAYPLSQTQAGIFVECLRFPDTTVYNIPYLYRLDEGVDMGRLKEAVAQALLAAGADRLGCSAGVAILKELA
jgi:hypothetical protein